MLGLCVLAVLSKREIHGYELVKTLSRHIEISEGTIYPLLKRISENGFATTMLKEDGSGPARKYYKITTLGIDEFHRQKIRWSEFNKAVDSIINEE